MCGASLVGCPHSLGRVGDGHDPLICINFPVGISLAASIAAHLSCLEGAFFVASFSDSQSTRVCDVSWSVYILCQQDSRGILNMALSIESLILV